MERNVAQIALFTALIAALGAVPPISLAFGVPITAQALGVMLAGAVLGAKRGFLAVALLLLLVAIGLPLLSGGRGGLGAFMAPSSGFLIGFPFAAWAIGMLVEKVPMQPIALRVGLASAIGFIGVDYAMGVVGMSLALGKSIPECLMLMTAFIPGDLLKAAVAGMLVGAIAKARPQAMAWAANR
ncbi:biotin transporter BioY [Paracoccus shanxieyensis]|uniref:Biotin transporter n=1 Tax=Paracoccus shanxieyensis TaxID=2675752 RepID=A0A6L6IZJ0_9RHOB|nr:biotin transporter BioY [Paracoccus shanxieyensis]MTH65339.1 BioY family transporter [Paracoccus shanxieyensis]MTH88356.1 BioY family transporter [Paracoccus shanxieyensis]